MRDRKKLFIIVVILLLLLFVTGGINFYMYYTKDKEPPQITYDEEAFYLEEDDLEILKTGDYTPLLKGIHATDNVDGDITDKVLVHGYKFKGDGLYAIITYMVMDSSDNMTKGNRILYLKTPQEISDSILKEFFGIDPYNKSESEPPVLIMEEQAELKLGDTFDPLKYVIELSDDVDSYDDLLKNSSVEGYFDEKEKGVYYLAFSTTDSDGNKSKPAIMRIEIK